MLPPISEGLSMYENGFLQPHKIYLCFDLIL